MDKEINYHRYWKEQYEKEHKLRQEAENEMVLIKGITVTNSPELRAANNKINDLENKIIADIGCGTGMLMSGMIYVGAGYIFLYKLIYI